jgi:histidinol-phosphate aminotransferase
MHYLYMQPRDLSTLSAYTPGKGVAEVAREVGIDPAALITLSSNENPHGPSPAATEEIETAATEVHRYPKQSHVELTEALAQKWDVLPKQIWLSPGADGAIDYLSRAFLNPGETVAVPEPGFSYYDMSTQYHHGSLTTYELTKGEDFTQDPDAIRSQIDESRILHITSPHNPSGSEMPHNDLKRLLSTVDNKTLVAVDEAYGEYSHQPSAINLVTDHTNIAVLRTFSKAYGLAGLRIGYAVVPEEWADAYEKINTPFAANEVACRAAREALADTAHLEQSVETARWAREYYRDELPVPVWPSGGNFVLCDVGDGTAIAEAALNEGIIIRDTTSFGLPGCVRLSCGTREESRKAVAVLSDILDSTSPMQQVSGSSSA